MIKKIIHVLPSLSVEWGGIPQVVIPLNEALFLRGLNCVIFATGNLKKDNIIQAYGVKTNIYPLGWFNPIWKGYSKKLSQQLKNEVGDCDLIHIHGLWNYPHFAAYKAAVFQNKPYVITLHGTLDPWALNYKSLKKDFYMRLIQRRILDRATAIQALTPTEITQINSLGIKCPAFLIPNGIDIEEFSEIPSHKEFDKYYPILKDKLVILFLGRIHPKKGLDILSKAFSKVIKERKKDDIMLVIAGPNNDGYRFYIEEILNRKECKNRVLFTGLLKGKQKMAALGRADIFVLSSYSEGFSIAILEALACKIPVIISHNCHLPDVKEARAGIIINSNENQLEEALITLLDNPQLRKEMGINGRKLVKARFTWEKVADRMIETYNNLLEA